MSWGDGVPNPFDEAKEKLITNLNARIGELEALVESCKSVGVTVDRLEDGRHSINNKRALEAEEKLDMSKAALTSLKKRLLFIRYDGMPFNQRLTNEEMVDTIDTVLGASS